MPVYVRYNGWYVYFWTNENDEPFFFISQRAGLPRMLRHILAVMQASVEEYKTLWLQYQKEIRYIDC